ncbi:MAG: hypothetical protein MJZ09_03125 [Bacteroidales bacterium]|nr:hypothetical protein [Bacteroidales bacterium]
MKKNEKKGLDIYSSPSVELLDFTMEGVVCITFGEPGTPGGELGPDDDDTILEF